MKIYQVDAFTSELFKGNPAGVCILEDAGSADDTLLQNIAAEMNLSETAFLFKTGNKYNLRWFTPVTEVDFCGHATLSSAHILWELGLEHSDSRIAFNTKSGEFFARRKDGYIELDLPSYEVHATGASDLLNKLFGITPLFTGADDRVCLIEISGYSELTAIQPDFEGIRKIYKKDIIVTCRSDIREYDFYSRFFAPAIGINEDPVTGFAHTYLTPYWSRKLNKKVLNAYQASKRGGELQCEFTAGGRVLLRGKGVTVFEIDIRL